MKAFLVATASLGLACVALPAEAAVTYSFVGMSDVTQAPQSVSFTLTDYLSGIVLIPAADDIACSTGDTSICTSVDFEENDPFNGFTTRSLFNFQTTSSGTFYYFDKAAFTTNGVYTNTNVGFNLATLTVSGFGVPAAVPEPATWAMLLGGFGLAGTALRRRRRVSVAYS